MGELRYHPQGWSASECRAEIQTQVCRPRRPCSFLFYTVSVLLVVLSLKTDLQIQWSSSKGELKGAIGVYTCGKCYERVLGEGLIKLGI